MPAPPDPGCPATAVRVVLVEPQFGGNVGSIARALKNLGYARLDVVRPDCEVLGRESKMMAVDALDVLEGARVHVDVDRALDGARTVAGFSCRRGKHRRPHLALDEAAGELRALARAGELALVFGREDRGLTDADLDRCTHLVHIPASEAYPSFNLAQAVLLAVWELARAGFSADGRDGDLPVPAEHRDREGMYRHLERALLAVGFLHRDSRVVLMRRLRRMLGRTTMTAEEVKLLRGVARQVLWAAGRAGLAVPDEPADPEPPAALGER